MQELIIGLTYLMEENDRYGKDYLTKMIINDYNEVYVKFTVIGEESDYTRYTRTANFNKLYTVVCTL